MSQYMDELDNQSDSQCLFSVKKRNLLTRSSLFLLFTLTFVIGNLILQNSSRLVSANFILISLSILVFLYVLFHKVSKNLKNNSASGKLICLICLGLSAGYGRAWLQADHYLQHALAANVMAQDAQLTGCISSFPVTKGGFSRFIIDPLSDFDSELSQLKRIRVNAKLSQFMQSDKTLLFEAGDCWRWSLRLKTTRGLRNQHTFDYEKWLYLENISATAYLKAMPVKLEKKQYPLLKFRARLAKKITQQLPEYSQITPLIMGLSIGIRDDLRSEHWEVLQKTGTSHLLAISGLHIGIAAILGFYFGQLLHCLRLSLLRKVKSDTSALTVALFFAMLFALAYSALAGFSVSTQRACIMLLVASLALISKRRLRANTILCAALLLVLLLDPKAILSSGTILSFMAVWVLIYLATRHKEFYTDSKTYPGKMYRRIKQVAYLQMFLVIFLALPVAVSFSNVSLLAPLVNFVLIPVFSVTVVPVLLLVVVLSDIFPALSIFLLSLEYSWLSHIWLALEYIADFPFASLQINMSLPQTMLVAVLLLPLLMPKKLLPKLFLTIALLPLLFAFKTESIRPGTVKMTVFDVGQGLSVLIQTQTHQLLYDTGPAFMSGSSAAERVVQPWLMAENLSSLSSMVLSHSDNDHAGGERLIRNEYHPAQVFAPAKDKLEFTQACEAGTEWAWDGVKFEFLYPFATVEHSGTNNLSCVLQVSVSDKRILLTGDIEKSAEKILMRNYFDLQNDIVFVPHHGSRSSSTPGFIKRVRAKHAIIPAGFANRWRFPKPDVLLRWENSGAKVYTIADTGELALQIDAQGHMEFSRWSTKSCRYWHQDCS